MSTENLVALGVAFFVVLILNDWAHRRARKHKKLVLAKQKVNKRKKKR